MNIVTEVVALKKLVSLILLFALILASIGCISAPRTENVPDRINTLRIGYQPTTHHVAEMVATEMGWWKEDLKQFGITEIKEFGFPTGGPQLKAMEAGDLDIAYLCSSPFILPVSKGLDAKIVVAVNTNGSSLVLRPDIAYDGPASLKGLHIGTFPPGTAQDTLLKKWLASNGVNISDVNITAMGPGDAVAFMIEGKGDGVFLPHPAPAIIEMSKKGRTVITSGEMWPNHACCGIGVSGRLIRDYPELVTQIIKTHINATEYANAHPDEAARIYSNHTGQDLAMVEHSIQTWDGAWLTDPHLLINDTLEFSKFQYQIQYTQKEVTEQELFDTSFYDKLYQL
ncbi:MAG: alkanesulfonate transporter substrate-binding subunit [Methanosaeta sp. PtaB.Bin039]|nr:MAG: alkanesulfonate transporter substrate-binding subunit [Methanosaeta sp. PtaB.Bin039]